MNKRLTLQDLELLNTASAYNGVQHGEICGRAALELIEYKKIEDELGIGLDVLYELLIRGCYYKCDNEILYTFGDVSVSNKCIYNPYNKEVLFKDYGKTWALTKEELQ